MFSDKLVSFNSDNYIMNHNLNSFDSVVKLVIQSMFKHSLCLGHVYFSFLWLYINGFRINVF